MLQSYVKRGAGGRFVAHAQKDKMIKEIFSIQGLISMFIGILIVWAAFLIGVIYGLSK